MIDIRKGKIKIHYWNYHIKHDEWIKTDSDHIAEIGYHTKAYGVGKTRKK